MNQHYILLLALAIVTSTSALEPAEYKKNVLANAEKNQVEARLDQSYASNDNPKQQLDLFLPKRRKSTKPLPVVAYIHGGGWLRGDRISSGTAAIALARTGDYAVVNIGYRLTNEAHWPEQIFDCKAAIRWIRGHAKELNLDSNRIAACGSSAGGHLSSLLGTSGDVKELEGSLGTFTTFSSRVTCVVNLCGPQDFTKALMFGPDGQPVIKDEAVTGLLGGTYEEKHVEAVAASPITYVTPDDPPFLTAHGTADMRVAFAHAEWIHAALKKSGVSSLLIPITGGGHGSVSHAEFKKRSDLFLAQHLRGIPAEIDLTPIPAAPPPKL